MDFQIERLLKATLELPSVQLRQETGLVCRPNPVAGPVAVRS